MASIMVDHIGGGSTCLSHSFNISLKHFLALLGWSAFIIFRTPSLMSMNGPISSQSADTSRDSSLSNVVNNGGVGAFFSRLDGPK